ncbi:MAG: redox-regulated molecular chaperone Hsp33 [Gammaproteobacteria bacterium]|nr:redox-regulated molecular chaperone Hsp33 [Gammaproteobacteria bacterium]
MLQPFMFEHLPVRGALVQLAGTWRELSSTQDYPAPVTRVLGEASAAAALIANSLKFDGQLTLQLSGDGPLELLVVQSTNELHLRGMALASGVAPQDGFAELSRDARCAMTVESSVLADRYQGIVDASGDSLADCLEGYFERSVQLPTRLWLLADEECAAGLLLQRVPDAVTELPEDDWRRLGFMADTLTLDEMRDGIGTDLLGKLFAEDDVRAFRPRSTRFECRCSMERVERALRLLGEEEVRATLAEQGEIRATCEFCNRERRLDPIDVERLFSAGGQPASSRVH